MAWLPERALGSLSTLLLLLLTRLINRQDVGQCTSSTGTLMTVDPYVRNAAP